MQLRLILSVLLGVFAVGVIAVAPAGADDASTVVAKLAQKNKAYEVQQTQLTATQETRSHLEGEARLAAESLEVRQKHLMIAKQQFQQKIQLFFEDITVLLEPEKTTYITAKQAVTEQEEVFAQYQRQIAMTDQGLKVIRAKLRGLGAERQVLRRAIVEGQFEQLRQQVEREQVVEAKGEFSCGQTSISECKRQALSQAQRNAVERGSAVLVRSASEVKNFELTRDELRTQVEALVLRHEIIKEGFVGSSGYFYTIRARVKGKVAEGLRAEMLREVIEVDVTTEKTRALLQEAVGFYTGASGHINLSKASTLFRQSAEGDNALAVMWLARCYHQGCAGLSQDENHSRKLAKQALPEVERLAYIGDAEALFLMGSAAHEGLAVKQSTEQALNWYRKAAEQGHVVAQTMLGVMSVKGQGVRQSEADGAKWFLKAAEQGGATAQYNLGAMYVKGSGVSRSDIEAIKWFRQAAERGDVAAQYNLAVMYDHGRGAPADNAEAVRWYRQAAEQNDAAAQYHLGFKYERGNGVEKSQDEAMRWYRKAAALGSVEAEARLQKLLSR